MSTIEELRFGSCAYFYKRKFGQNFTNAEIDRMLVDVTQNKQKSYLFNISRHADVNGTKFSLRIFKDFPKSPRFIAAEDPNWKELKIGYYLFIEYKEYVAILRKYAIVPNNVVNKLESIDYNTLISFKTNDDTELKKLSMQNLDGSDHAMRSKSFEAIDLKDNVSPIGSSRYYIRSLKGNNGGDEFALTLYSSRINEFQSDMTVSEVCEWVRTVVDQLMVVSNPSNFMLIFAKPEKYSDVYKSLKPASLLIHSGLVTYLHDECKSSFYHVKGKNRIIIKDDVLNRYICNILKTYEQVDTTSKLGKPVRFFTGIGNTIEITLNKSGIKLKNKFWENVEIDNTPNGEYDGTLADLINRYSLFNVYFSDTELIYNNKILFRDAKLMSGIDHYLSILEGSIDVDLDCEKHQQGDTRGLTTWGIHSMFAFVERTQTRYQYLICDDYNDEWADHIGIGTDIVTFFIEKQKGEVNRSASDFQEVVGQAQKNLANLSATSKQLNDKLVSWQSNYLKSSIPRYRSNAGNVNDAIKCWNENVFSPKFRREMCLVVDFLSKDSFTKEIHSIAAGDHIEHEASIRQRLWLLSSFVNSCLEYGVFPRIICKP